MLTRNQMGMEENPRVMFPSLYMCGKMTIDFNMLGPVILDVIIYNINNCLVITI